VAVVAHARTRNIRGDCLGHRLRKLVQGCADMYAYGSRRQTEGGSNAKVTHEPVAHQHMVKLALQRERDVV
jgi:hypothetical protein